MENANASQGGKLTFCTKTNITCVKFDCGMGEGGGGGVGVGAAKMLTKARGNKNFLVKFYLNFVVFVFTKRSKYAL